MARWPLSTSPAVEHLMEAVALLDDLKRDAPPALHSRIEAVVREIKRSNGVLERMPQQEVA